jgi:hypothetical protein
MKEYSVFNQVDFTYIKTSSQVVTSLVELALQLVEDTKVSFYLSDSAQQLKIYRSAPIAS